MLTELTDGTSQTWLGAIRTGPVPLNNTQWTWIDGTPMMYDNWNTNEPNNHHGIEFCLCINYSDTPVGTWNDVICDLLKRTAFICQVNSN